MHCVLFRIPPGTTREAVIEKLKADKRVLIVQPLNEFESAAAAAPAATPVPGAPGPTIPTRGCSRMSARWMSSRRTTSAAAPAFASPSSTPASTPAIPISPAARIVTRNYIDNDDVAFRSDRHGTQVAGLIAAAADNGIGIVGVAPDVKLLAYKACWQASANTAGRCNSFTIAQALADALTAKAQVINLSLVGPSDPLARSADRASHRTGRHRRGRGVGRSAPRLSRAYCRACCRSAEAEHRWVPAKAPTASCARPARDIVTLVPNGHYDFASGSSLATAQISGVVALLLARNQKLGVARLRELLHAVHRKHDTTRGPFLSVNACTALARWCAARAAPESNGDIPHFVVTMSSRLACERLIVTTMSSHYWAADGKS